MGHRACAFAIGARVAPRSPSHRPPPEPGTIDTLTRHNESLLRCHSDLHVRARGRHGSPPHGSPAVEVPQSTNAADVEFNVCLLLCRRRCSCGQCRLRLAPSRPVPRMVLPQHLAFLSPRCKHETSVQAGLGAPTACSLVAKLHPRRQATGLEQGADDAESHSSYMCELIKSLM